MPVVEHGVVFYCSLNLPGEEQHEAAAAEPRVMARQRHFRRFPASLAFHRISLPAGGDASYDYFVAVAYTPVRRKQFVSSDNQGVRAGQSEFVQELKRRVQALEFDNFFLRFYSHGNHGLEIPLIL
jgi:hypothetical protein